MADILFLRAFIGDQQYHFARDLDGDLLQASEGEQSVYSAMIGALQAMAWDLSAAICHDRHKEQEKKQ
jgi:hypothetical protein